MKTLLPNSKKCLTANWIAICALAILTSLPFTLALLSSEARADIPSRTTLEIEINANTSSSFQELLSSWQKKYGIHAINPLFVIASSTDADRSRYIAILGAARLGGQAIAPRIVPFLKDRSWMIRNAALKSLAALKHPKTVSAVLPLLHDPALVVRVEAIETVRALKPPGAVPALLQVLHNQENYHFGKSQWAPLRALQAIAAIGDKSVAPELAPLLDHQIDPPLQRAAISALQTLTGHREDGSLELVKQAASWKQYLAMHRSEDKIQTTAAAPKR